MCSGESAFRQEEYEEAMQRLDDMGVRLSVLGIGFQPMGEPVDKSKSRNKVGWKQLPSWPSLTVAALGRKVLADVRSSAV